MAGGGGVIWRGEALSTSARELVRIDSYRYRLSVFSPSLDVAPTEPTCVKRLRTTAPGNAETASRYKAVTMAASTSWTIVSSILPSAYSLLWSRFARQRKLYASSVLWYIHVLVSYCPVWRHMLPFPGPRDETARCSGIRSSVFEDILLTIPKMSGFNQILGKRLSKHFYSRASLGWGEWPWAIDGWGNFWTKPHHWHTAIVPI